MVDYIGKAQYDKLTAKYPQIVKLLITIIILINLPLVILIWMLFEYCKFFWTGYSSKSWPTTEGIIDTSSVETIVDSEGTGYKAIIKYSYFVLDKQHHSYRIYAGLK